jgi:hypothetical protein
VPYREADLSRVTTIPVAARRNKVDPSLLAAPPGTDRSFAAFFAALPDVLAARDLRAVIAGVAAAARGRHGVVPLVGGHVVKVGSSCGWAGAGGGSPWARWCARSSRAGW